MTAITSRPQIFEIESQVRPLSNRDLMVGMQVAFAATECSTQFVQHLIRWWVAEARLPEHLDDLRRPPTIHAPPAVTLEAEDPQSAMTRIVSALSAGTTMFVMFTLTRPTVLFAATAGSESGTARG